MIMKKQGFESASTEFLQVLSESIFTEKEQEYPVDKGLASVINQLKSLKNTANKVYLIGNGGSAAVAGHVCVDLINVGRISSQVLHDAPQLTCFSNDYGYEQGYAKQLEIMAHSGDMLIAISSSGQSQNILNAIKVSKQKGVKVFTLTGFSAENKIRSLGDWNYWLDSQDYGQVEIGHLFLLHYLCSQLN